METELAKYLHELGVLKRVQRSGWWLVGVKQAENVAEHSFRTAAIAYFLAGLEKADILTAVTMALFHDAGEARVNDLHRLGRSYVDFAGVEEKVIADQTRRLPRKMASHLRRLFKEMCERKTREARVANDADLIECLLQACEYAEQGYPVDDWIQSTAREVTTRSAKKLARAILKVRSDSWRSAFP